MKIRDCSMIAAALALSLSACTDSGGSIGGDTDGPNTTKGVDTDGDDDTGTKQPGSQSDSDSEGNDDDADSTTSNVTGDEQGNTDDPTGDTNGDPPGIDDEFDGDLSLWRVLNPGSVTLALVDGFLHLDPGANTLWFEGSSGPLVWQLVEGNFMVTADVTSRRLANPDQPPLATYRTGGLMARNPADATENYVFIAVGSEENPEAVETKTTTNSQSVYDEVPWPGAEGEVRICRIGPRFEMLIRERGGTWQTLDVYQRPDLPAALQVGPFGFAYQQDPDLRVSFDWVRFAYPSQQSDCTQ